MKLMDNDNSDYDFENDHIKNLFHKLGVVYNQDDIMGDSEYYEYDTSVGKPSSNSVLQDVTQTKFRHAAHRDVQRTGGCPSAIGIDDGHTIADKTRLYKLCEPVHKLPVCR